MSRRPGRAAAAAVLLMAAVPASAQDRSSWAEAIEDNSFFIEEAYNQGPGVVQHIGTFAGAGGARSFGFTQEWPFRSQAHQLSYSLSYLRTGRGPGGIGDVALNYRYQLRDGQDWAAIAPRLSVLLPTGDEEKGLGTGEPGLQLNLPISRRASEHLAWHVNVGTTLVKGASSFHAGGSVIALLTPKLNAMLELLRVDGPGDAATTLSPGLRGAIDLGSLQIVPGIAVPLTRSGGATETGLFLYLSFEHPFGHRTAAARP